MGLDMYLYRARRYKDVTPKDLFTIDAYFEWRNAVENKTAYSKENHRFYTLEEWHGIPEESVRKDLLPFYKNELTRCYYDFDKEHQYGYDSIMTEIAYWRKANHIHKWFVDNVQYGVDDCGTYEVTEADLKKTIGSLPGSKRTFRTH